MPHCAVQIFWQMRCDAFFLAENSRTDVMTTDMGVLILSQAGQLRLDSASAFKYTVSRQKAPAADKAKSGIFEIDVAVLNQSLIDFGISADESECIVAVVVSKAFLRMPIDAFTDAYRMPLEKAQPAPAWR